jgi:transposase
MTHELHRLITAWLPSTSTVHLTALTIEEESVVLHLTAMAPTASCPRCTVPSSSVHSRYGCHVTDLLCQMDAGIARAHALSRAFLAMVREHRGEDLEAWMTEAMDNGIDALTRFARGLQEDVVAVKAGLTLEWSNGVTEGQIHRLKLIKHQGYGRAGFALLRQRVLQVA